MARVGRVDSLETRAEPNTTVLKKEKPEIIPNDILLLPVCVLVQYSERLLPAAVGVDAGTHNETICERETKCGERSFPSEHWESHERGGRRL